MTMPFPPPARQGRIAVKGFMPLYHGDGVNHCPGCSGTHWHIGRISAECATCRTAIPLAGGEAAYHG